tara:strand:- start:15709 stop:15921 length:213 start_codon:yes stop_codon:yes gene_type:complete
MVEVLGHFGDMKNKHASVVSIFGDLKINFFKDYNFCKEVVIKTKSLDFALSMAENWSLDILDLQDIPEEI